MNTNQEAKRTMQTFVKLMERYTRNKLAVAGEYVKGNEQVEAFLGTFYRGRLGSDLNQASEVIWNRLLDDACEFVAAAIDATNTHVKTHKEEFFTELDLHAILMQVALDRAVKAKPTTPEDWQDIAYVVNTYVIHSEDDVWERADEVAENVLDLFAQAKRKLGDFDGEPEDIFGFKGPFLSPGDFDGDTLRLEVVKNRTAGNLHKGHHVVMDNVQISDANTLADIFKHVELKQTRTFGTLDESVEETPNVTMKDGYNPTVVSIPPDLAKSLGFESVTVNPSLMEFTDLSKDQQDIPDQAYHVVNEMMQYTEGLIDLVIKSDLLRSVSFEDWIKLVDTCPSSNLRVRPVLREIFGVLKSTDVNVASGELARVLDKELFEMLEAAPFHLGKEKPEEDVLAKKKKKSKKPRAGKQKGKK